MDGTDESLSAQKPRTGNTHTSLPQAVEEPHIAEIARLDHSQGNERPANMPGDFDGGDGGHPQRLSILGPSLGEFIFFTVAPALWTLLQPFLCTLIPPILTFAISTTTGALRWFVRTGYLQSPANETMEPEINNSVRETTGESEEQAQEDQNLAPTTIRCTPFSELGPLPVVRCPSLRATCLDCLSTNVGMQDERNVSCPRCGLVLVGAKLVRSPADALAPSFDHRSDNPIERSRPEEEEEVCREGEGPLEPITGAGAHIVGEAEPESQDATDVEDEVELPPAALRDRDASFRIQDAIVRCTEALGRDLKASLEAGDGNSDVEAYARSVLALTRLRRTESEPSARASGGRSTAIEGARLRRSGTA